MKEDVALNIRYYEISCIDRVPNLPEIYLGDTIRRHVIYLLALYLQVLKVHKLV